jgi:hypothetical protein
MKTRLLTAVALIALCGKANAELMTVQQLKEMMKKGEAGEIAATAYVQGVVDGMAGVDWMHHKEQKTKLEFCALHNRSGTDPVRHPAYNTKTIVGAWEKQGHPMSTSALDMILAYLSHAWGCKK